MNGMRVVLDKLPEFRAAMKMLQSEAVYIGVAQENDARKDGGPIGNATIGYINENGSAAANIPARPHLVPGVAKVQDKLADELGAGAKALLNGRPDAVATSYTRAGLLAKNSVQDLIQKQEGFAPLAKTTLRTRKTRKKAPRQGEQALIDKGEYLQTIKAHIRKRAK